MTSSTTSLLNILAHEVDPFIMAPGAVIYPPMTSPGTQPAQGQRCILILYSPFNFILQQNAAFQDLKLYVRHNVRSSCTRMEVRMAVCGWFARRNGSISVRTINCTHQANTRQISLRLVNHLHDFLIKSTFEATMEDEARLSLSKVPAQISVTISRKRKVQRKLPFSIRTRADCLQIQQQLMASSRSKQTIKYDNGRRHLPGQRPLLKKVNLLTDLRFLDTAPDLLEVASRVNVFNQFVTIHQELTSRGIFSPRDHWEDWLQICDPDSDPAFMCLVTILMSSSTSDAQLALIMPRLFASGITSPTGVVEVVKSIGVDALCALFSESGRFYQNVNRILNAADYFIQQHKGRIPPSISVNELCKLQGIGYKTANIVLTSSFHRVEGIPSDVHVLRWCSLLGWYSGIQDGRRCSKSLERWIPRSLWPLINPIFGSFGQLLGNAKSTKQLLEVALSTGSVPDAVDLINRAMVSYSRKQTKESSSQNIKVNVSVGGHVVGSRNVLLPKKKILLNIKVNHQLVGTAEATVSSLFTHFISTQSANESVT
jgi:endonuclease III